MPHLFDPIAFRSLIGTEKCGRAHAVAMEETREDSCTMTCARGPESRRNRSLCCRRIGVRVGSASEYPQVRDLRIG